MKHLENGTTLSSLKVKSYFLTVTKLQKCREEARQQIENEVCGKEAAGKEKILRPDTRLQELYRSRRDGTDCLWKLEKDFQEDEMTTLLTFRDWQGGQEALHVFQEALETEVRASRYGTRGRHAWGRLIAAEKGAAGRPEIRK